MYTYKQFGFGNYGYASAMSYLIFVVIAIVAAIRKPMAYGIGLALVCVPALWFVFISARDLAQRLAAPSIADQEAGRGYFATPADRALAEAIVAGDVAKVASLAPAANLNAQGWGQMTFMRLALENGHANHDVLAILLRNRIDPDQDASLLYQMIYNQKDEALLRVVIDSGVDLSKHMGRGCWFYFVGYNWPAGLALVLDHGADTEAQDTVGYTEIMRATLKETAPMLPAERPRYLMGVGTPADLLAAVARGIDMFDCVLPTRSGRTGQAFTADGPLNLRNARFAEDCEPIEPGCPCPACTTFSRAYVHHLVKSGEILGAMLMTQHNLWFYQRLMQGLRDAISERRLQPFASEYLRRYRRAS
jgi:hypothetical protein